MTTCIFQAGPVILGLGGWMAWGQQCCCCRLGLNPAPQPCSYMTNPICSFI